MRSELVGACSPQAKQARAGLEVARSHAGLVRERACRDAWWGIGGQCRDHPLGNESMAPVLRRRTDDREQRLVANLAAPTPERRPVGHRWMSGEARTDVPHPESREAVQRQRYGQRGGRVAAMSQHAGWNDQRGSATAAQVAPGTDGQSDRRLSGRLRATYPALAQSVAPQTERLPKHATGGSTRRAVSGTYILRRRETLQPGGDVQETGDEPSLAGSGHHGSRSPRAIVHATPDVHA